MDLNSIKQIHIVGIGGIGTSAIARIFVLQGKSVSGSDRVESTIAKDLKQEGVEVKIGHKPENISPKTDLVIFTDAITKESEGYLELEKAKEFGIPVKSYAEILGMLMDEKFGIAVAGTSGKSTTTALVSLVLVQADLDPSVVLGTLLPKDTSDFSGNARLGKSRYIIAEADEYLGHMLYLNPKVIVITNIAEDHLDYYKDLSDIKQTFGKFIDKLSADGVVIYNADDHNTVEVVRVEHAHKLTFGIEHYADLQALNLKILPNGGGQEFDVHYKDALIGKVKLKVPGRYNVSNALGAFLVGLHLGIDAGIIIKALENFKGLWRRFEIVGEINGKLVVSDYAHHPDKVRAFLSAAKEYFGNKKLLVVFQPHQHNRTKSLFKGFVDSLLGAKTVIITEIFDVVGREEQKDQDISSKNLVDEVNKRGGNAVYSPSLQETEALIRKMLPEFDAVLIMGAGDIDNLARKLVQ